jgi:hypothetical protein
VDDYQYIHDPEHRNKPHGTFWPTSKGWSNNPEDAPKKQYPYQLSEHDKQYFEAIESQDLHFAQMMVNQSAKKAGYTSGKLMHGSPKKGITKFDISKSGYNGETGGIFFTDSEALADRFSHEQLPSKYSDMFVNLGQRGEIQNVFLNFKNPLDLRNVTSETAGVLQKIIKQEMGMDKSISSIMEDASAKNKSLIKLYLPTTNLQRLKDYGYDGYIAPISESDGGGNEYVALDSEQVKSADPIVKDDAGNVVPLSQRFNTKSKDIRY